MTEPMGCAAVQELAAELALGLVAGPERARALGHLDSCPACRSLVDSLARTGDALLVLAPGGEPGPGFETRVVERMVAVGGFGAAAVSPPSRRRWRVPMIAAAAAAVVALAAGVVIGQMGDRDGGPYAAATMRTAEGERVGELVVGGDDRTFVFIAVPAWEPDSPTRDYVVRVDLASGEPVFVENVSLVPGSGTWGTVLDVEPDEVVAVSLLGREGRVWCSARVD
jgi:hypothetical protein